MTTIKLSKYKICRRVGASLWGSQKDAFNKRNYRPGQHGKRQRREVSNFGKQGLAQRSFKNYYIMGERQFRRFFKTAKSMRGNMKDNLIGLLERRLSAVVYNARFGSTMFAAKQLVSHKHVLVNGRKVNISSYLVNPGDVIELSTRAKNIESVKQSLASCERRSPDYIEVNQDKFIVKMLRPPVLSEVPYPSIMNPQMVIEFYSGSC